MENNKTAGKPRFKVKGDTVLITLICIFLASAPFYMSAFRTNMLGKYMCFALIALGIGMIWGQTGILSLGHGVYFGLGAYCMAMHLKLIGGIRRGAPGFYGMERTEKTAGSLETICQSGIYHILCDSSSYAGGSSYRLPYVPEPNPGRVLLHTVPGPCLCSCYISHWETGVFRRFQWFD